MNIELKPIAESKVRAQGGQGAEVVAWCWDNHGRHVTVDKSFAKELVADGETVRPLVYGDAQPAVPECPYPCGWDALRKIIVENAANFARSTLDDEVPESVRQMGIDSGQHAIRLCNLAMKLSTPATPQADGWKVKFMQIMGEIYSDLDDEHEDPIPSDLWELWRDLRAAAQPPVGQEDA